MVIFKYFVVKMISVKIGNKQKRGQDGPFLKKLLLTLPLHFFV